MEDRADRNQVFGMAEVAKQLQADQVRAQMGVNLPINDVPLASRGRVYAPGTALHMREKVGLKAMTVQEENILTTRSFIKKGTVITELIKSCIVDKSIDVGEMLSGDRNTLMVAIRSEGYGNIYPVEVKCSSCGETSEQEFDLNQFAIKLLDIDPVEEGKNEFLYKLPSGTMVTFKFLTGQDEENILAIGESKKKNAKAGAPIVDDSVQLQIQFALVSVDGKYGKNDISNFVRTMRARDSQALRKYIGEHQPGIKMTQDIVCPHCEHEEKEADMPIGISFFWPDR